MVLTAIGVLTVLALGVTIAAAMTPPRAPIWVAVLFLCLIALLQVLPLR
jgi:hypothetical protein